MLLLRGRLQVMPYRAQGGRRRDSEIDAVPLFLCVGSTNGLIPILRDGFLLLSLMAEEANIMAGEMA